MWGASVLLFLSFRIETFRVFFAEASERPLDLSQPVHGQLTVRPGKRLAVFLRYRDEDPTRGFIRIYPKGLR